MKIPNKINICGKWHDVIIKKLDDSDNYGLYATNDCKIYLCSDVDRQIIEETFLHEILHGADMVMGNYLSEEQIKTLSKLLYQILKDNRLLRE